LGKAFNGSLNWVLLYESSIGAKLIPPNESTAAGTDDVVVLFEFDHMYIGRRALRILTHASIVSPKESLIDYNKRTDVRGRHNDRVFPAKLSL